MENLINVYMKYLTKTLVKIALMCFKDESFVESKIERYVKTYIDNRYYNIFHTVDDNSTYNLKVLEEEFNGLTIELLDEYSDYELIDSNEKYSENVAIIKSLTSFCLDLVKVDDLKFKNDYYHDINNIFRKYDVNVKYINKVMKKFVDRSQKFLSLEDSYFSISYDKISNVDNCLMVKLNHNIDVLEEYRWVLIDRVFIDERLDLNKWCISLQKFSLFLLNSVFNKKVVSDKYFIDLDGDFITRKVVNEKLSTVLDNPILRKNLVLVIPFDELKANKDVIEQLGYTLCVKINLEHIADIGTKIEAAKNLGTSYILVSDYKDRDADYIKQYRISDDEPLLIYKEVE